MRDGDNHRAARTIVSALVAGLVAFESVLAVAAGVIGIPGISVIPLSALGFNQGAGGESVIAKQSAPVASKQPASDQTAANGPDTQSMPPPVVVDEPEIVTGDTLPSAY